MDSRTANLDVKLSRAASAAEMPLVRELFQEYAHAIEIDLCFQNFEQELAELPGRYGPPEGVLFLARVSGVLAGCVGLRGIGEGISEMKRLYFRPGFRRAGLGRALANAAIEAARQLGYKVVRLDTLSSMREAIALYESLGFQRIAPYYDNPSGCAVFLELKLRS